LSQDFNIFLTFVTDDEGMQDVELVRVHAWSSGAESGKEENMATAMTAVSSNAPVLQC